MTALLIAVLALEICYPFALVRRERRKAKQSSIDGRQVVFTGSAVGLFGNWIKWLLLSIVTFGVYLFWVERRVQRWMWEHTELEPGRDLPWDMPHRGSMR
jgi:uncharacterized membrane protein YjgN (DUF898 family)